MSKPFFTYYGGKYRIALKYPSPLHDVVIEPFAGSAGYSVRWGCVRAKLYDVNPRVIAVWQYLIKAKESEIRSLPLIFDDVRNLKISQEAKWLIGFWCNKGSCEPRHKPSAWMRQGLRPNSMWGEMIRERIACQLKLIRNWQADECSYEKIENQKATWFIDPPYQNASGRHYTFASINYDHLSQWTRSLKGQIIACEGPGATWLPFREHLVAKSLEGSRGKKKSTELIFTREDT